VDALINQGLTIAPLKEETKMRIRRGVSSEATVENPIDLLASGGPEQYELALSAILEDPNVDSVIVIFVPPILSSLVEIVTVVDALVVKTSKPVLGVIMGRNLLIQQGIHLHFPAYRFPESAVYSNWRKQPEQETEIIVQPSVEVLEIVPDAVRKGQKMLTSQQILKLFTGYGFSFPKSKVVMTKSEMREAAKGIGYPVVMKMASSQVIHKTEKGGVILDIRTEEELWNAWEKVQAAYNRLGIQPGSKQVLVQQYLGKGVEVALGASVDPQFGPICMVGSGGVLIEVLQDVSFGKAPVGRVRARKMIRSLKLYPVLLGYRGDNPVDLIALEDCIIRLSQLISENRAIVELDINPLLLFEKNPPVILDARARVQQHS
jgi:acetyltransferase